MFRKKEFKRCFLCRRFLSDTQKQTGFCADCALLEIKKMKRRIRVSAIIGAALVAMVFSAVYYARVTSFELDGNIFVPVFFGYLSYNSHAFSALIYPEPLYSLLFALLCFFAPFADRVNLQYETHRNQAELDLYKSEPLTGRMVASSGTHRMDSAGVFMVEILLSIISGPLFFVYRPIKILQLSNYVKKYNTPSI